MPHAGAGPERSRSLPTNQEALGGPAGRDVAGKAEWAGCGTAPRLPALCCARTSGLAGSSSFVGEANGNFLTPRTHIPWSWL